MTYKFQINRKRRLTLKILDDAGACPKAQAWFTQIYGAEGGYVTPAAVQALIDRDPYERASLLYWVEINLLPVRKPWPKWRVELNSTSIYSENYAELFARAWNDPLAEFRRTVD